MLIFNVAEAQPFTQVPSPPGGSTSISHFQACKSSLSGPAFIQLLNTIIKHGDLTDVAFVEKTLGTKFSMNYRPGPGGVPDAKKLDYQSDHVFGAPIQVSLLINNTRQQKGDLIATIYFNADPMTALNPTFISDCLHMSVYDFSSVFGEGFIDNPPPVGGVPVPGQSVQPQAFSSARKYLYKSKKNGSTLSLGIGYRTFDLTVSQVGIAQNE